MMDQLNVLINKIILENLFYKTIEKNLEKYWDVILLMNHILLSLEKMIILLKFSI